VSESISIYFLPEASLMAAVIIPFSFAKTRLNLFAPAILEMFWPLGQLHAKSPPGPNLHTSSNPFLFISIFSASTFLPKIACFLLLFYRQTPAKNPNKNRTKMRNQKIIFDSALAIF
jgi:hypothetical protein